MYIFWNDSMQSNTLLLDDPGGPHDGRPEKYLLDRQVPLPLSRNGGSAGERQHPDDADGARHWRIFPRVTFAVRLLYNRRVCFPKYTKR